MKRKKTWFMGLAILTATILMFGGHEPSTATLNLPAWADAMPQMLAGLRGNQLALPFLTPLPPPKPSITPVAESSTETTETSKATPSPALSEKATDNPKPKETSKPSEEATKEAVPAPAVAPATTPNNSSETISAPKVPLREQPYKDPQGRFEVGILENYNVSAIDENPLIESPDGTMAYTVVVQPKITNGEFSNEALAQIAINQFQRGEGFQPEPLQVLANGEILIPWTGTVTIGRTSQPISGSILVKQSPDRMLILLVSATENASQDISSAIATLADTLKFL